MRLIDADALWDELTEDLGDGDVLYTIPPSYIDDAPTVDAVPVVRCRECKYTYTDGCGYLACVKSGLYPDENDYCSRGKRRDQSADVRNMEHFAGGGKTGGPNDADQH